MAPELEIREHERADTTGPYDIEDAPDDGVARVDLGALRLPPLPQGEVHLDVNKAGQIVSATLRRDGSAMQIGAFAAPRQTGIWPDIRAELLRTLTGQGGSGDDHDGPFGVELRAQLAMKAGPQPARFIGVDGPRWFLRALITGPAAADDELAAPFTAVLRNVVVVRGNDPMPVREQIPLRLPKDPETASADGTAEDAVSGDPVG